MRLKRGFTFIEGCICIVTFSVISALVFPHMVREASSREHRLFKKKLTAMVDQTRSRAIETQRTVALSFRKEDRSIEAMEQDQNQVSKPFPDLKFPENVTAAQLFADKDESPPDGWQVAFYADGKSTGGGIEFQDGEEIYSFVIDPFSAKARLTDGRLPDLSKETWSAGGLAPRAQ